MPYYALEYPTNKEAPVTLFKSGSNKKDPIFLLRNGVFYSSIDTPWLKVASKKKVYN
jgi:hypothetical protein